MPKMPKGIAAEMEQAGTGSACQSSVAVISAKEPADLDAYRHVVLDACTSAAEAAGGGVSPDETAVLGEGHGARSGMS